MRDQLMKLRKNAMVLAIAFVVVAGFLFFMTRPPIVHVAPVVRGDMPDEVEGTGTVTADAIAEISPKIIGRVEAVSVNEGDFVEKGQTLAILDETELKQRINVAKARLASATATSEERQREWSRELKLVESGAVSIEDSQQYTERMVVAQSAVAAAQAETKAAEYDLTLTRIPALFSGIITKRQVMPGSSVVPGQTMFTLADTRLIYVASHVDQDFTGKLKKGELATVILRGRETQPLSGNILRISPEADAATEETVAEVAFTLPRDDFILGQWANVFIRVGEAKNALIVPRSALMQMGNRTVVFVVDPTNVLRVESVVVLTQSPRQQMVAVKGNLQPEERVVLMPMGLTAGKKVRPKLAKPNGEMGE